MMQTAPSQKYQQHNRIKKLTEKKLIKRMGSNKRGYCSIVFIEYIAYYDKKVIIGNLWGCVTALLGRARVRDLEVIGCVSHMVHRREGSPSDFPLFDRMC